MRDVFSHDNEEIHAATQTKWWLSQKNNMMKVVHTTKLGNQLHFSRNERRKRYFHSILSYNLRKL